jgi:hypothetical protein
VGSIDVQPRASNVAGRAIDASMSRAVVRRTPLASLARLRPQRRAAAALQAAMLRGDRAARRERSETARLASMALSACGVTGVRDLIASEIARHVSASGFMSKSLGRR